MRFTRGSVVHNVSVHVDNVFNTGTIYWPGFPAPGRSYRVQYRVRF